MGRSNYEYVPLSTGEGGEVAGGIIRRIGRTTYIILCTLCNDLCITYTKCNDNAPHIRRSYKKVLRTTKFQANDNT